MQVKSHLIPIMIKEEKITGAIFIVEKALDLRF